MSTTYPHYHFRPSKNWINDPNGTIYHNNYYHLFYQYNPTSDCWGNLHWGHARTKDFINYEVLKDSLYPQHELNEKHCFSGCLAISKTGVPTVLYTSVADDNEDTPNIQKAVFFDENIEHFEEKRVDALTVDMEGIPEIRNDWRDPYVFQAEGRYFLVIGAAIGVKQSPSVLLFECSDGSLTNWTYKKELIQFKPIIELFECPNFFRVQDKWILLGSPYNEVEYYIGTFDINTLDFKVEKSGIVDHCAQFYATNTFQDDKNRSIVVAFERGFSKDQGWNNVISIPREFTLSEKEELIQQPIEEMKNLRGDFIVDESRTPFDLNEVKQFIDPKLVQSEINFKLNLSDNLKTNIILRSNNSGICQILFSQTSLKFDSIYIPFEKRDSIDVKLLIDHSIMEIFINGGRQCATRVVEALKDLDTLEFRGNGTIEGLKIFEMNNINVSEEV